MKTARTYGISPYRTFLVHGGPGAAGEMASVAKVLSTRIGVVEPLQSKKKISALVLELKDVIEEYSDSAVTLVGYSWGAWLSFVFAGSYPNLVKKLIIVGSGPFEDEYAKGIKETRLSRLSAEDRKLVLELEQKLFTSGSNMTSILLQYGNLMTKADTFEPMPSSENDDLELDLEIFQNVWREANELRASGDLLQFGARITCPVVAIHGEYDPHPYLGVTQPLSAVLTDFRYSLLEHCGHIPWKERIARDAFYKILFKELMEE